MWIDEYDRHGDHGTRLKARSHELKMMLSEEEKKAMAEFQSALQTAESRILSEVSTTIRRNLLLDRKQHLVYLWSTLPIGCTDRPWL